MNDALDAGPDCSPAASGATGGWIGRRITATEIGAIMFVGTVGYLISGCAPVLLGALVEEGRLSVTQLGQAATAENLSLGAAASLAAVYLRPVGIRWWIAAAGLVLAVADVLTVVGSNAAIVITRGIAGLPEGILVWVVFAMVARAANPGRWSAIFSIISQLTALCFAVVVPGWIMHRYGAAGGYVTFSGMAVLAILVAFLLPRSFVMPQAPCGKAMPAASLNVRVAAVLVCLFLFTTFMFGVWIYFEPLSAQAHHAKNITAIANSLVLAGQTLGSLLAAFIAQRVPYFRVLLICYGILFGTLLVFASIPGPALFLATAGVFGFLVLFIVPFQITLAADVDPTRQAVVMSSGAMQLGSAAGPFVFSLVVSTNIRSGLVASATCLLISFLIVLALQATKRKPPSVAPTLSDSTASF
jgi:MFS transporter, DHA1 family, inner membrane transport protein